MKKGVVLGLVFLLFLAACGGSEVSGKRVASPTAAAVAEPVQEIQEVQEVGSVEQPESTQTAAEALKNIKAQGTTAIATDSSKSGSTFFPPVSSGKTGEDALKERNKAAYGTSAPFTGSGSTDSSTGSRYYDDDGNAVNLPDDYDSDAQY